MGDPLSVAAGAIGVVSFGIQACRGLLLYYDDCKSFDDTVVSLCQKVAGLVTTLEICEQVLSSPKGTVSRAYTNVLERIDVSRDSVDVLERALDVCQKHPKPQGFRAKFHNFGKQVLFPFRKPHLQKLLSAVSTLQNDFQAALSILQTLGVLLHSRVQFNFI